MQQRTQLKEELAISGNLAVLTQAYQEHAIQQINFSRYSVLASRDFVDQLVDIFSNVKASYRNSVMKQDKKKQQPIIQKNGKSAFVLVTANNKLYGEIIPKLCRLFIQEAGKDPKADLFTVGQQGQGFLEAGLPNRQIRYIRVPDTNITINSLKELTSVVLPYEKVTIFYGKFINLVSQEAVYTSISGDFIDEPDTATESTVKPITTEQDFLFEPSLPDVANFFEDQIFSLILNQRVHEAQLGKFASRVKAMERAQSNMQQRIKELRKADRRMKVSMGNKKQQGQLAGRLLWNTR